MRLLELRLNHFGKFHNKTIKLEDGLNLIYGDNEAGKSTIHTFIKGMLFGIEKLRGRASKDDTYMKYQPWDNPGAYSGSLDIDINGKVYRILRNFDKNNKNFNFLDLETGREIPLLQEELKDLYGGLTESGYRNTVSIEQLKARTDQELAEEVRNYITNLSLSKSNEVDISKALSFLQEKRKEIEAQQINAKLTVLEEEIEEGLACETRIDRLTLQLKELEIQEENLQKKMERVDQNAEGLKGFSTRKAYQSYLMHFPVIREKYRSFCEGRTQSNAFAMKLTALQNQEKELKKTQDENESIKLKIAEMEAIKVKLTEMEEGKTKLNLQYLPSLETGRRKIQLYSLIPIIAGVLGIVFFFGKNITMLGISVVFILFCISLYFHLSSKNSKKQEEFKQHLQEYEKEITYLQTCIESIYTQNGVHDEQELRKKQENILRCELSLEHIHKQDKEYKEQIALLEGKLQALEQEVLEYLNQSKYLPGMEERDLSVLEDSTMNDLEGIITEQKQKITREQENLSKEAETYRLQIEKLKWELNAFQDNEENLYQNKLRRKELIKLQKEQEEELTAIKLAAETIQALSTDIHDSFGQKLNNMVSLLTSEVTNGKYSDVKLDEKLSLKVGDKDNYVLLDRLSAGTIEQLYFAMRLGISNLIYGEGTMPILLDDCFALYDDNRTQAVLETLSGKSKGQVLLFTCHNREKDILDGLKSNYNYINLSE